MSTTVSMPQLGETVTEGPILSWAKQAGDSIAEDEVLLEISTDKVDTEIPAPREGFLLKTWVAEGQTVAVDEVLAHIGNSKLGNPARFRNPTKITFNQCHLCATHCHVSSCSHGDAYVCLSKSRRIVNAIANHAYFVSRSLKM